jgi:hypothetical protein
MDFKDFLTEAAEKHGVLAYGRMNPPTAGHEQVINKVHEVAKAHNAIHKVVLSHSQDAHKNPLPAAVKVKHAKHAFPGTHIEAASKEHPTIMHHAAMMHKQGVKHLHVVAGSDRTEEYHKLLHKYNDVAGKHGHYNFKSITVHSSGERDPDSEGTKGVSGTKMREYAAAGKKKEFHAALPSHMKQEHKESLYSDLRHHMGVKEVFNPHLKVSKYQWGEKKGVNKMKEMTPGQNEAKEADYGADYQASVKKVGKMAKEGQRKVVWVPAKFGTGGVYKTVPVNPIKVKESFEAKPMYYTSAGNKIPFLCMSEEQRQSLLDSVVVEEEAIEESNNPHFNNNQIFEMPEVKKLMKLDTSQKAQPEKPKQAETSAEKSKAVEAGASVKPQTFRQMQFKHYVGL